jgi:ribosomal protein L16 Arg81 hydroxylase
MIERDETRLDLDWELWVIDQLVAGAAATDVVAALVEDGLDRTAAIAAVEAITHAQSFERMRRRTARSAMGAQILEARRVLAGDARIDRRATIDHATFHERYWQPSRPVLFEQLARPMRAVREWTFGSLAERFGDVEVEVNHEREAAARSSETEARGSSTKLRDYLAWAATARSNDRYIVSRNGLLANPALRALWDDLDPLPELFAPPEPPRGASLWIGPAGTRSAFHFDPHAVMLVQIAGTKRVRLVAPDQLAMFDAMDGYFSTTNLDELPAGTVLDTELHPGEALFVPLAYFHEVTALEPSITLSLLCFRWPNDFHWLQPR